MPEEGERGGLSQYGECLQRRRFQQAVARLKASRRSATAKEVSQDCFSWISPSRERGRGLIRAIYNLPTRNSRHNFPRKLPSVKRSIARQRPRLGSLKRPALLRVEDGNVGKVPTSQRPAPPQIKNPRGASSEKFDNAGERNFVLAM